MLVRNGTVDFNRHKGSGPRSDRAEVIFPNAVTREPSPARASWRIAVRRSASARLGACGGSQGERYRRRGTRARPWAGPPQHHRARARAVGRAAAADPAPQRRREPLIGTTGSLRRIAVPGSSIAGAGQLR